MGWRERQQCTTPHVTRQDLHIDRHHMLIIKCRNGSFQVHVACNDCGERSGPLGKDLWATVVMMYPHDIRHQDNSVHASYPDCVVDGCDEPGMEHHHFAPVNTFGWREANRWPLLPLCKAHHRFWHLTMDGYRWHARGVDVA
jgi:hypothetical protein